MNLPQYWLVAFCATACGTSPEFVEGPEDVPSTPAAVVAPDGPASTSTDTPEANADPCGLSSPAVRAQARRSRYIGAEGFDSRMCPPVSDK